uniref:Major facilitator superfamily (MFS) profile domain-containing protein n=1 Tax=Rhizochromulina marina TaxID=1034831 RepID=A0A7S2WX56_9STRA
MVSMETTLLTFIAPCACATFGCGTSAQTTLWAVTYAGNAVGAFFLGPFADIVGRWTTLYAALLLMATFSFASSLSPDMSTLIALRAVVGVGEGTIAVALDLLAEFLPPKIRGTFLNLINLGWAVGVVLVCVIAKFTIPFGGWRDCIAYSTIPIAINTVMFLLIVESPRWLLMQGRHDDAMQSLRVIATRNGTVVPCTKLTLGKFHDPGHTDDSASLFQRIQRTFRLAASAYRHLFSSNMWRRVAILSAIWILQAFLYSSLVIMDIDRLGSDDDNDSCSFRYDFAITLATAEIVAIFICLPFVDRTDLGWFGGRFGTQWIPYLLCSIFVLVSGFGSLPVLFWAYLARLFGTAGDKITFMVPPEYFPTRHRATGSVFLYAIGIIGSISGAYWANDEGDDAALASGIAIAAVLLIFFVSFLPETAGVSLDDLDHEDEIVILPAVFQPSQT